MAKHNMPQQLKRLREERGWSQAAMAREAGVGQTTITLLESGKRAGVNLDTLVDIAIALSKVKPVSLDELVGYDATQYYTQNDSQPATLAQLRELGQKVTQLAELVQRSHRTHEESQPDDRVRSLRPAPPKRAE